MTTDAAGVPGDGGAPGTVLADPRPAAGLAVVDDAADRGRLTIGDKVVGRVVAHTVTQHDTAAGVVRRVLGIPLGSTTESSPARVDVKVDGSLVSVSVRMSVPWPQSVRQVTREVRTRIEDEVSALTGLRVVEVDIVVAALRTEASEPGRVV